MSSGKRSNISEPAEVIEGDVHDPTRVLACMKDVDGCFHLAAIASVELASRNWIDVHRINLTGAITVFDAARQASSGAPIRVVYTSSAAVYGASGRLPLSETDQAEPISAYGADKRGCELHARVATLQHGVPTVGLRLFNVYGPRQDPHSPYSGVISIFADRLRRHRPLTVTGDGHQVRDFIYVGDVVRFMVAAMQARVAAPEVINVCTGRPTSILNLASAMRDLVIGTGRRHPIEHAPARRGDIPRSIGNPKKASTLLGEVASTRLEEGLRKTFQAMAIGRELASELVYEAAG